MHFGFTSTTLRQIKDIGKIVEIAKSAGAECIEWGGDIHVTDIETAVPADDEFGFAFPFGYVTQSVYGNLFCHFHAESRGVFGFFLFENIHE
jgi:hypothetical protein